MIEHDIDAYRAFTEALHPRGTGALGGQFVASGGGAKKAVPARKGAAAGKRILRKPAGMSFDGKRGTGYGIKGGDKRVRALQQALNRLGLTDSSGKKLVIDGKLGPKTTAAIKKAQRKLGLKADGVVTPALLKQLTAAKKLEKARAAKKVAPAKKAPAAKKAAAPYKRAEKPRRLITVHRSSYISYSDPMTDETTRHASHNQKSHGNRLRRPGNIPGKTGLAKAAAAVASQPEQGPARPKRARTLDTYARRREAVRERYSMTRDEFDKLPSDERDAILQELRSVAESGDTSSGRDSMGILVRGPSDHVSKAKELVWRFTRDIPTAPDNSVAGRSARLLAATTPGEARAALYGATKADMEEIAAMNGDGLNGWRGGTSRSWKADKWREYLINKALGRG